MTSQRALKAFGLRCAGLTYREIGARLRPLDGSDRTLSSGRARQLVVRGSQVVRRWRRPVYGPIPPPPKRRLSQQEINRRLGVSDEDAPAFIAEAVAQCLRRT